MPMVEVSDECLAKIKEQLGEVEMKEVNAYEDLVGSKYYFRTVTYHLVGEVARIVGRFAYLKGASWVPDSGRFTQCIMDGTLSEVEPVGDAFVNLDSVTDFFPWKHRLPTEQK